MKQAKVLRKATTDDKTKLQFYPNRMSASRASLRFGKIMIATDSDVDG